MNDPDPFYEEALGEIEAFSGSLYSQSFSQAGGSSAGEEIAPLFRELSRIRVRYETSELIGRGGMKEIYRAYDCRATRHVALAKPVKPLGEDSYDAFLREAHITARLDHPGIVKLFDMGIDEDGLPFFTMELKKGRSLRDVLRAALAGSDFPLRRRLEIMMRVCEAVSYAHSKRVLHLDLKPENIQVGEFGEVHVCDWGMGVVIRPDAHEMRRSEALLDPDLYGPLLMHSRGTRGYMAPEQFQAGQAKSYGMDVFALGCMLGELLTLLPPDDEALANEIPDDALRAIVRKARHPSPEKRYLSVEAFLRDLSRHVAGYSTSAEGAGFFREMKLFHRRNRVPCHVVGALLLLTIALTAMFIVQLHLSRGKAVEARHAAERTQALYLDEKIKAQAALRNFISERKESDRRLLEQSELAARSVTELTNPLFLVDDKILPTTVANAMKHLDAALALNPPPESPIWHQKFWLLFLIQDFEGALSMDGKQLGEVEDLRPLAERFAPHAKTLGHLPAQEFGRLFGELAKTRNPKGDRRKLMELMLIHDLTHQRPLEDRVAILRGALGALNPQSDHIILDYKPADKSLRIQGKGVRYLSITPTLSLLRILDTRSLDLRGTSLENLGELDGLSLHDLNLQGTPVRDLKPLTKMRSLRRLLVAPGQFNPQQLSGLPPWIATAAQK